MDGVILGVGCGLFVVAIIAVLACVWFRRKLKQDADKKNHHRKHTGSHFASQERGYQPNYRGGRSAGPSGHSPSKSTDQNLAFYRNQIKSRPNGDYIENILKLWKRNYKLLEKNHDFIQWLFPNRNPGVNKDASILNDKEAKTIRETPELRNRVKRAFEMMLDFYGMTLDENDQFQLSGNHVERLRELNQWGNHNFLRISRILMALKELGHKELMLPWMKFLAHLIYQEETLDMAKGSFKDYWIDTLDAENKIDLEQHLGYYTG